MATITMKIAAFYCPLLTMDSILQRAAGSEALDNALRWISWKLIPLFHLPPNQSRGGKPGPFAFAEMTSQALVVELLAMFPELPSGLLSAVASWIFSPWIADHIASSALHSILLRGGSFGCSVPDSASLLWSVLIGATSHGNFVDGASWSKVRALRDSAVAAILLVDGCELLASYALALRQELGDTEGAKWSNWQRKLAFNSLGLASRCQHESRELVESMADVAQRYILASYVQVMTASLQFTALVAGVAE